LPRAGWKKGLSIAVLMLAVAGGVAATRPPVRASATPERPTDSLTIALPETAPAGTPAFSALPLPPPEVATAPIAMLVDVRSGQMLYGRDIDRRFLPASVTKVMTLYLAFDLIAQGKLSPDRMIIESNAAWREWHAKGSRMFLSANQPVSVDALLMGIANVSANDGCIVLAEGGAGSVEAWVAMMNDEARKLGMTQSHFGTPNGWMDGGNTYYTARDLSRLANAMLTRYPTLYHRYIGHPAMTWNGITQPNHDPTLGVVPGADGIKTGFTEEAGYNFLGSAERDGRRLVMVVAHLPQAKERAKASRALLEWGFAAWDSRRVLPAGKLLADAQVQGGTLTHVGLATPRDVFITLPKGSTAAVSMRVRYTGPLVAPIMRGTEVARLELRVGAQPPAELPLVAVADVPRGDGIGDRLWSGLSGLLQ